MAPNLALQRTPPSAMQVPRRIRMKSFVCLLFLSFAAIATGTELRLTSVTQPLYLHGSDTDPKISIESVPYVTFGADPEWRFTAISVPFVPPTGGSKPSHDVNLASLYHIFVTGTYKDDGKNILVTIDASKALQPAGYPFSIEQVIDAVVTCVNLMYPQRPPDEGAFDIVITRPEANPQQPK